MAIREGTRPPGPRDPQAALTRSARVVRDSKIVITESLKPDAQRFSYQPSSAITTSIDLTPLDGVAPAARRAPTKAMDPEDPILYPRPRSASIARNVAPSSTVISSSIRAGR